MLVASLCKLPEAMQVAAFFRWEGDRLRVQVRVQPGASRDAFEGCRDAQLRVRLTAPPVGGAANQKLRKLLGKQLRLAPGSIEVVKGHTQRNKVLMLTVSEEQRAGLLHRLKKLAEG